jgi:hypothetical protein
MHHPATGGEQWAERRAYQDTWWDRGWRSDDDPSFEGVTVDQVRQYIRVPPFWGEHWYSARRQASARLVRVGILSASIAVGEISSNWRTKGWPALLAADLQAKYGDGGSGWISPAWSTIWATAAGGGQVTRSGNWTRVENEGGITKDSIRPTASGNGATMTFPFRGTTLDIFTKTNPTYGRVDYRIDGATAVQIPLNEAVAIKTTTVTGLAPGNHTVQLIAAAGDSRIFGVRGRNATGVIVDNISSSGQKLIHQATATTGITDPEATSTTKPVAQATLDTLGPFDVIIVGLGPNDAIFDEANTLQDSLWDALDIIHDAVVENGPSLARPPELVTAIEHIGTADTLPAFALLKRDWTQIVSVLRDWSDAVGAAVVDHWAQGRHSWSYWQNKTYWGNANTDAVHPNDAGHAAYAAPYISLLR